MAVPKYVVFHINLPDVSARPYGTVRMTRRYRAAGDAVIISCTIPGRYGYLYRFFENAQMFYQICNVFSKIVLNF